MPWQIRAVSWRSSCLAHMRNQITNAFREFHDFAFTPKLQIDQIIARRCVIHGFSEFQ
jgi:hypothetical protein